MAVGSYIGQINIGNDSHAIGSTLFGMCNTPAGTAAKVATLTGFNSLPTGVTVHILFTVENTVSTGVTLQVGTTDPKPITNPNGSLLWNANSIISFTYDGTTNWVINSAQIDTSNITIDMNQLSNLSLGNITNEGKITNSPNRIVVTDNNSVITTGAALGSTANGTFLDNTGTFRSLVNTDIPDTIARLVSPSFTGTPTAPTIIDTSDNSTKIATTAFVTAAINAKLASNDAMLFKGTIGTNGTITSLPTSEYQAGWTYRVITAGEYAGQQCEVGDLIIAISDGPATGSTITNSHWTVAQNNIDGYLTMTNSSLTNGELLVANGSTGSVSSAGYTIATPSAGALLVGNGTTAYNTLIPGTNNQVLTIVSGNPTWTDVQHFISHLFVTTENGTTNTTTALDNGNVFLRLFDTDTARESHKILGAGGATVTADTNANIVITSKKYKSLGSADAFTGLKLSYTTTTDQEETVLANAPAQVGYVDGGILYIKSINYSTTSVSTGVTEDNT